MPFSFYLFAIFSPVLSFICVFQVMCSMFFKGLQIKFMYNCCVSIHMNKINIFLLLLYCKRLYCYKTYKRCRCLIYIHFDSFLSFPQSFSAFCHLFWCPNISSESKKKRWIRKKCDEWIHEVLLILFPSRVVNAGKQRRIRKKLPSMIIRKNRALSAIVCVHLYYDECELKLYES